VRKVLVCAIEADIPVSIELLAADVSPIKRDLRVAASNPIGKVPTLVLEDGTARTTRPSSAKDRKSNGTTRYREQRSTS
jgi:glutathione S-transferase